MKSPEVHFRLKPADDKDLCLIYLQFIFSKQRLFYSFGQKIKKDGWNEKKQRVKNTNLNTEDGKYKLNDLLDNLEKECNRVYTELSSTGIPTPSLLKSALDKFRNKVELNAIDERTTLHGLIDRFINNEILSEDGKEKAPNTIKFTRPQKGTYRSLRLNKK